MRLHSAVLVAAILSLSGCGGGSPDPGDRGAQVYGTHCASCHQRDGQGVGRTQPAVAGSATAAGDPDKLIAWMLFGVRPETNKTTRSIAAMPQFYWLSDDDVAAVLTHIRTHFGNLAAPITAADVAAVRAAGASQ
jgi:mono/diheme cytochrome c family protein